MPVSGTCKESGTLQEEVEAATGEASAGRWDLERLW
jgi:hypothetical protein